eukprot:GDKI01022135.1.p1 GENE.GDKI01022135.1~~GDKI01022135.1.p1  ORF type:complete len:376 (-),score=85.08 GDKI01022135.1:23-1150(-)
MLRFRPVLRATFRPFSYPKQAKHLYSMQSFLSGLLGSKKTEQQQQQRPADVPPSPAPIEENNSASGQEAGGKEGKKDKVYLTEYPQDITFLEDPCLACLGSHEKIPATLQSKIDTEGSLLGSVKPYKQHFLIAFGKGNTWPHSVEDSEGSFIADFQQVLEESNVEEKTGRIMVTAIDRNIYFTDLETQKDQDTETVELLHFPSFCAMKINRKAVPSLVDFCQSENFDVSILRNAGVEVKHVREHGFVLVCVHKLRDKRCGVIGPLLIESFQKSISKFSLDNKIEVVGVSHIGGHKWAGNIIIYSNRFLEKEDAVSGDTTGDCARAHEQSKAQIDGHWYGRVFPDHTDTVVEQHFVRGGVCKQLWRGRMDGCVMDW